MYVGFKTIKQSESSSQPSEVAKGQQDFSEDVRLTVENVWGLEPASDQEKDTLKSTPGRANIVRVFVSSTFKDCFAERECFVKKVFPVLREWCQERGLTLVECDLRWGIPRDSNALYTLVTCMEELDRCHDDSGGRPFFLSVLGERYGWIPDNDSLPEDFKSRYSWLPNCSVTHMEVMHGAYRCASPNALFLLREPITDIPPGKLHSFASETPLAAAQISRLKEKIHERFGPDQIHPYSLIRQPGPDGPHLQFQGLDTVAERVLAFFSARLQAEFGDEGSLVNSQLYRLRLLTRRELLRADMLTELREHVQNVTPDANQLNLVSVCGPAGSGKSTLLAHLAASALAASDAAACADGWRVFYSAETTEQRLCDELRTFVENGGGGAGLEGSSSEQSGSGQCSGERRLLLVIDALDELDTRNSACHLDWLTKPNDGNSTGDAGTNSGLRWPCPTVAVVAFDSAHLPTVARLRDLARSQLDLSLLDLEHRRQYVTTFFNQFNKRLDAEQLKILTEKSGLPLWLSSACEELRVFGEFARLTDKIRSLPTDIGELFEMIISRLVTEDVTDAEGHLRRFLLLLALSVHGLPEAHVPALLGVAGAQWARLRLALKQLIGLGDVRQARLGWSHADIGRAVHRLLVQPLDADAKRALHRELAQFWTESSIHQQQVVEIGLQWSRAGDVAQLTRFLFSDKFSTHYLPLLIRCDLTNQIICGERIVPIAAHAGGPKPIQLCMHCATKRVNPLSGVLVAMGDAPINSVATLPYPSAQTCPLCHRPTVVGSHRCEAMICMRHSRFSMQPYCLACMRPVMAVLKPVPVFVCRFCMPYPRCCAPRLIS